MSIVAEAPPDRVSVAATVKTPARIIALAGLAAIAPFDLDLPADGWTRIYVRPLMLTVIVVSLWIIVDRRASLRRHVTMVVPAVVLWLAAVWTSTAVSDAPIVGAAGAIRLTAFGLLIIATSAAVRTRADAQFVFMGLAGGLLVASVVGLIVFFAGHDVLGTEHLVGGVNSRWRLTRPWSHPNVAGMAIGASLPAFWLCGRAWRLAAIVVVVPVVTLTCGRGAVLAVLAGAIAMVALQRRRSDARRLGAIVAVGLLVALVSPGWADRFGGSTEEPTAVSIEVPPAIRLEPAGAMVRVDLTNLGTRTWQADRTELSARWIGAGQGYVWGEHRWALTADVMPGETIRMDVGMVSSIPSGTFDVRWDLVDDGKRSLRSFDQSVISHGVVLDSEVDSAGIQPFPLVLGRTFLQRPEIWDLAVGEFLEAPLLGVGPSELSLAVADQLRADQYFGGRHAHSLLLEPLATTGVLGALPLFVVLVGGLLAAARRARHDRLALIASASLTATLVHGLFDWSLVYTSVAIPIALVTGIAWTLPRQAVAVSTTAP